MKFYWLLIIFSVSSLVCFGQTVTPSQTEPNDDSNPIKVSTTLVNIPVIASDRDGRNIIGLTKENFTVVQDGAKQPIAFFADGEAPLNVAIMIDTSGSTLQIISEIKSSAKNFIFNTSMHWVTVTGGKQYASEAKDLEKAFQQIADELKGQNKLFNFALSQKPTFLGIW